MWGDYTEFEFELKTKVPGIFPVWDLINKMLQVWWLEVCYIPLAGQVRLGVADVSICVFRTKKKERLIVFKGF